MKRPLLIPMLLIALLQLIGNSVADNASSLEIRGEVATDTFTWTADNFAGFYYHIDDNIKTEELTATVTDRKLLEPNGVTYTTTVQSDDFDFAEWGSFNVIGFMAEKYFAGYIDTPDSTDDVLFTESDDENVLSDEQLLKILKDDDTEMTVTSGAPLALEEGYELAIKSIDIDGSKVYLELTKDDSVVDNKVIYLSSDYAGMKGKTYHYKKDIGDSKDVVIIAVHFKNAFRGADQNLATVDGLWQLSDSAQDVSENTEYDKMTIQTVTVDAIIMNNEDNDVNLSKNMDSTLMGRIKIKTADQEMIDNDSPLRYYIYKEIADPGIHDIRSSVATDSFEWNAQNFAGFYYDIDKDLGTERIATAINSVAKLDDTKGIVYSTTAQKNSFDYSDWGYYNVIGFAGKKYFAGYIQDDWEGTNPDILNGANAINLLDFGILTKVLIDKSQETVQDLTRAIDLKEGYSLKLTIASDKKGVLAELLRDKKVVDKKAVLLPGTYVYTSNVGNVTGVPLVVACFQEPIFLKSKSYYKIYGLWQISENPIDVSRDSRFGILTVSEVDSENGVITLDNRDNAITLSKNMNITIMPGLEIRTADADELRYCLLKHIEITYQKDGTSSPGGIA